MAEAREADKVETWARKIGITRQVLVDDLGAFSDLAGRMAPYEAVAMPIRRIENEDHPKPLGRAARNELAELLEQGRRRQTAGDPYALTVHKSQGSRSTGCSS